MYRQIYYRIVIEEWQLSNTATFTHKNPDDVIIPVIHGRKDTEGNIVLSTNPLDESLRELIGEQLPIHVPDPFTA